jgi:hypothetical protein
MENILFWYHHYSKKKKQQLDANEEYCTHIF